MISFAIIGFGHIGRRHAEHILNNPEASFVAVCDTNPDTKKYLQNDIPFFTDHTIMLQHINADVVSICTPNHLHVTHTIDVLKAGCHAITEKPMALSTADCDLMIDTAKETQKTIFAVKQNRYNPPVQAVKELIDSGKLGKIFMMQVNCFWNRSDAYYAQSQWRGSKIMDGGILFTQFSHFVDILYYLNGNINKAQGLLNNFSHQHNIEFEDTAAFVMEADNGAIINFNATISAFEKNMEGSITIIAENGTVKIGGQYLNTLEYQCIRDTTLQAINISAHENDYGLYKGSMSNHDKVIQNVIDVLEHNKAIMTSAEEGKDVIRIIETMYRSIQK